MSIAHSGAVTVILFGGAEYSRTFMRIACHYLEGKDIHPVSPSEVQLGAAPTDASASDASSTTGEDSEEVQSEGPERVSAASDAQMLCFSAYCLNAVSKGSNTEIDISLQVSDIVVVMWTGGIHTDGQRGAGSSTCRHAAARLQHSLCAAPQPAASEYRCC